MTAMQTHLRTMMTSELREFKKQITPNATQILVTTLKNKKTSANPLSRETSPHANRMLTEIPPSRETGPHHAKSTKKLAQALKKSAKYEAKRQIQTPNPYCSQEILAEALKHMVKTPRPNPPMRTLANALRRYTEQKSERPTHAYAEWIRELIGSPEQCKECGGEHPTRLCMKRFEKLRKPETTPLPMTDDDSTSSDTLYDSEESEDSETESLVDLNESMTKLS